MATRAQRICHAASPAYFQAILVLNAVPKFDAIPSTWTIVKPAGDPVRAGRNENGGTGLESVSDCHAPIWLWLYERIVPLESEDHRVEGVAQASVLCFVTRADILIERRPRRTQERLWES